MDIQPESQEPNAGNSATDPVTSTPAEDQRTARDETDQSTHWRPKQSDSLVVTADMTPLQMDVAAVINLAVAGVIDRTDDRRTGRDRRTGTHQATPQNHSDDTPPLARAVEEIVNLAVLDIVHLTVDDIEKHLGALR
jgi:hypothetical protein